MGVYHVHVHTHNNGIPTNVASVIFSMFMGVDVETIVVCNSQEEGLECVSKQVQRPFVTMDLACGQSALCANPHLESTPDEGAYNFTLQHSPEARMA